MGKQKSFRTIEDYLTELNSEAFSKLAEESIRYTQGTRCEAGFQIGYSFPSEHTADLANNDSDFAEVMSRIYGKNWNSCKFIYPDNIKTGDRTSINWGKKEAYSKVIGFHTHPQMYGKQRKGKPLFSWRDLKSLNIRKSVYNQHNHNPISVVLKVNSRSKKAEKFPIVITQEKPNSSLDENTDYKAIANFMDYKLCAEDMGDEITEKDISDSRYFSDSDVRGYYLSKQYNQRRGDFTIGKGFSFDKSNSQHNKILT